jgi:FkbM family methyltransferase
LQSFLRKFGLRLSRLDDIARRSYGLNVFFTILKQNRFSPRHIIDVGANHSNWTRECLRYFPDAQYTLLEPQDNLKTLNYDLIAAGHKITWVNAGASDTSGTLPFHISDRDHSSTFVDVEGDPSKTVNVDVISLDDLLVRYELPVPELVKIDAEGFDLRVLQGAKTLLGKTDIFLIEAVVVAQYENPIALTMQRMTEYGYHMIDITGIERSPRHGVLWLVELAFLRDGSPLLSSATTFE